jgi:sugar lactone lactonase YvrE
MPKPVLLAAACAALILGGVAPAHAAKGTGKPAQIIPSPSGATLERGEQVQFTATAYDKLGNKIPGVAFTWTSAKTSVASITSGGLLRAGGLGAAIISVKGGGKVVKLTVNVVTNPGGGTRLIGAGLGRVRHVIVDNDNVYWTETNKLVTRVRKAPKTGGPIYDLAVENAFDARGLQVNYLHLQERGDNLYFTRQTLGFLEHYSIREVAKAGGKSKEILPEDVSAEPTFATGWRVVGKHLAVLTAHANLIDLDPDTRLAVYDLDTEEWSSAIIGEYTITNTRILAEDGQFLYLLGVLGSQSAEIVKVDPAALPNSQTRLLATGASDGQLDVPGAVDAANLYFWQKTNTGGKLMRLSLGGGAPNQLFSGALGFGTTTDGISVYWVKDNKIAVRLPVAGGGTTTMLSNVFTDSIFAPLAVDGTSLYLAQAASKGTANIVQVPK